MTADGPLAGGVGGPGRRGPLLAALRAGRLQGDEARLRAAADLLEGAFFQELFKAMRATVPSSGLLDGGTGEEMFDALMDEHLAEEAARRTDGGVGSALYRWLVRVGGTEEAP